MEMSVIHPNITEQVGHGFAIVDPANGFRQNHADVHCLYLRTLKFLDLVWNGVGHDYLYNTTQHDSNRNVTTDANTVAIFKGSCSKPV